MAATHTTSILYILINIAFFFPLLYPFAKSTVSYMYNAYLRTCVHRLIYDGIVVVQSVWMRFRAS